MCLLIGILYPFLIGDTEKTVSIYMVTPHSILIIVPCIVQLVQRNSGIRSYAHTDRGYLSPLV